MKLAIQLFGHLRSYQQTFEYLQAHVLNQYDCDVFIHTWSEEEHSDPSWHKDSNEQANRVKQTDLEQLKGLYQPKRVEVEDNAEIEMDGFFNPNNNISLRGLKAMVHSQIRVNQLRLDYSACHQVDYDYVLMLRPDVLPLARLNLTRYVNEFDFYSNSVIHFSAGQHTHIQQSKKIATPLATDIFVLAKPEALDKVFSLLSSQFEKFYCDFNQVNSGGISAPEASFLEAISHAGLISRFYEFPYALVRTSGSNHLKANFDALPKFDALLPMPEFLRPRSEEGKKSWSDSLWRRLSNHKLEKVQKQLNRTRRQIDQLIEKLQVIKEDR